MVMPSATAIGSAVATARRSGLLRRQGGCELRRLPGAVGGQGFIGAAAVAPVRIGSRFVVAHQHQAGGRRAWAAVLAAE
jgi:hypothetical protein